MANPTNMAAMVLQKVQLEMVKVGLIYARVT
jgi:hypothetical protein